MKKYRIFKIEDDETLAFRFFNPESWMSENDVLSEISEDVCEWASFHGYVYDDLDWEFAE